MNFPRRSWIDVAVCRALAALVAVCLIGPAANADTLPLPANLIGLGTQSGEQLLFESEARRAYWPLSMQFVTQKNQAFCGVATMVMVLNALDVAAPPTAGFDSFNVFTQDNALDERTERVLPLAVLMRQGMTLDQFGKLLEVYGVKADVQHAQASNVGAFRTAAVRNLSQPKHHVVVNYLRRVLGQERGGHISPLAAYDAKADRFLVLDVSRYKYPPVWVTTEDLFAAMNTVDNDNDGKTRGFVLIESGS
jgi:hypothetical protein